jgi:hypothetical protein
MICDGCEREVFRARCIIPEEGRSKWLCKDCDPGATAVLSVPGSGFPFCTNNLGPDPSRPIVVQSLRHLRRLENQYGVENIAYNYNSNRFDDPPRRREDG